jgi:hypothetical protein
MLASADFFIYLCSDLIKTLLIMDDYPADNYNS